MATAKQSKLRQKSYGGKSQPNVPSKRAKPTGSVPSAVISMVKKANSRQKNFAGGVPGVVKLGASAAARAQKFQGPSTSRAQVAPATPKRMNTPTMRSLMIAGGTPVGKKHAMPNRSIRSYPADMFGSSATPNKSTKKVSVNTPSNAGPKVTFQKRAAKGSGKKPYVLGS